MSIKLAILAVVVGVVSRSVIVPAVVAVAFWPALLAFVLGELWQQPAMVDYLNEIGYTSLGYDKITPLILLFRRQAAPEADRLRRVARRRTFCCVALWLSTPIWFLGAGSIAAFFRL